MSVPQQGTHPVDSRVTFPKPIRRSSQQWLLSCAMAGELLSLAGGHDVVGAAPAAVPPFVERRVPQAAAASLRGAAAARVGGNSVLQKTLVLIKLFLQCQHWVETEGVCGSDAVDDNCQHGGGLVFPAPYFRVTSFWLQPSWAF